MILDLFKKKKINKITHKVYKSFFEFEDFQIPKFEFDSQNPGPTIVLTSGIHGDEIAGNVILMKFANYFKKNNLNIGKIIAFVGVNISGGRNLTREITETGEDLNRLFGGKINGSFGERLAYKISQEIISYKPSLVIDLHNDYFFSTPYILLDPKNLFNEDLYKKTSKLAVASDLHVIQERDDEREIYENSLSAYLISQNIPSITIEGGPDKLILKKHIDNCFEALLKIIYCEKMIDKPNIFKKLLPKNKILENGLAVKVESDGNMKYVVDAGEYVKAGQVLAKIYSVFGENLKNISAPYDAFVLGHSEKIAVKDGDEIYWLGKI